MRIAAVLWIPLALATDLLTLCLRRCPYLPALHAEKVALGLIHISFFAAAYFLRVGAAAAAAAECIHASHLFSDIPARVITTQIELEYSLTSLSLEAGRSFGILCTSLALLGCKFAQVIASCILCAPIVSACLLILVCLGLL